MASKSRGSTATSGFDALARRQRSGLRHAAELQHEALVAPAVHSQVGAAQPQLALHLHHRLPLAVAPAATREGRQARGARFGLAQNGSRQVAGSMGASSSPQADEEVVSKAPEEREHARVQEAAAAVVEQRGRRLPVQPVLGLWGRGRRAGSAPRRRRTASHGTPNWAGTRTQLPACACCMHALTSA